MREALGDEVAYVDYFRPGFPLARAVMDLGPLGAGARGLVLGAARPGGLGRDREGVLRQPPPAHRPCGGVRGQGPGEASSRPFADVTVAAAAPTLRRQKAVALLPRLRAEVSPQRAVILHLDDSPGGAGLRGDPRARGASSAAACRRPSTSCAAAAFPLHVDADLGALGPAEATRAVAAAMTRYRTECEETFERHRGSESGPLQDPVPRVVLLPGLGVVTAMKDKANAVVGNLCYRHVIRVMEAAEGLGGFQFLDEADATEFEYWPLELAKLKQPERELARQVALVTGAASGIGRAIAERFARRTPTSSSPTSTGPVREVAAGIGDAVQGPAPGARCRRRRHQAADAAESVRRRCCRTAGSTSWWRTRASSAAPVDEISEEDWDGHFDVNVKGTFLVVREAVRVMKAQGRGAILFNASKGAFAPTVNNAAYASSKAAVAALARNLATELGPHGIRVNYFNADFVDTPMMRA